MAGMGNKQSGAVSIFIVVFTALLMSIVAISFVRLMISEQQQATVSDLSQSAYDSALAGVEDAKRLLLLDQACRNGTAGPSVNCVAIASALTPAPGQTQTECDTLSRAGLVTETNGETLIQQSAGDVDLDQAYTCVRISKDTEDYQGSLDIGESVVIPLQGASQFSSIELSWFSEKDISSQTNDPSVAFPSTGANVDLPPVGQWQFNAPALLRAQVIQLGGNFTLNDLDDNNGSATMFLYPSATGATNKDFALDTRRDSLNAPQPISCRDSLAGGGYACTVTLDLVAPPDGNVANRNAYLRLGALYNESHFRIKLKNSTGADVSFSNVQPEVDSTGRANDLFRRVVSRVELKGDFNFPDAEVDLTGDLCKNFSVTSEADDYQNTSTCTP